jgi:hypothetical protein
MTAGGRTRSFRMRVGEPDPGRVLTESGCRPAERSAVEGGYWRPPSGVLHAEGAGPSPPGRGDGLGVMWVNACARDTAGRKVVELLVAGRRGGTVRWLLVVATVAAMQLWAGGPVWAEQPLRVDDQVTDRVGALAGDVARVRGALERLREANGTQLFVVYVSSFDGMDGQQWSDETARRSQLGDRDVLLAVAVDDRAYGYSVPGDFPLSDSELADLAVQEVEPRLAAGDWAGAAVAMADGLRTADGGGGDGGGGLPVGALLVGAGVVGGAPCC